ncbi:MAG: hypothetical protein Q8Q14_01285 [Gemmatimonadales bacterium]|nr:hypothetical protein [Gemmatimonadales bacterium]
MKRLSMSVVFAVIAPLSVLAAQEPRQRDTTEAGRLRGQIEQRFRQRVQEQLQLTPDQATKLQASQERFGIRRRELGRQQMERRRALEGQMQPGVAANADSVRKLMDAIHGGRAELLKIDQDEDRELAGYLTPVQRARLGLMRERLHRRVNEMREQRRGRMGPGAPGERRRPRGPGRRPI